MPRLSPAVKESRRRAIADAAMACIDRDGIAHTSMAAIIAETGTSAGAVYSHFESKTEIIRYAAEEMLRAQHEVAAAALSHADIVTPRILASGLLERLVHEPRIGVALQLWGEVARDAGLSAIAAASLAEASALHARTLLPWATAQSTAAETTGSDSDGPNTAEELAASMADALLGVLHGWVVRTRIDPSIAPAQLARSLANALPG